MPALADSTRERVVVLSGLARSAEMPRPTLSALCTLDGESTETSTLLSAQADVDECADGRNELPGLVIVELCWLLFSVQKEPRERRLEYSDEHCEWAGVPNEPLPARRPTTGDTGGIALGPGMGNVDGSGSSAASAAVAASESLRGALCRLAAELARLVRLRMLVRLSERVRCEEAVVDVAPECLELAAAPTAIRPDAAGFIASASTGALCSEADSLLLPCAGHAGLDDGEACCERGATPAVVGNGVAAPREEWQDESVDEVAPAACTSSVSLASSAAERAHSPSALGSSASEKCSGCGAWLDAAVSAGAASL